tara:strand:- start:50 stop:478 length:429 start_codon:yes stop_codon:yes gene_type:complete
MGMMKEFKEFAMRGNVVDMAIGIVIGASFGKIVTSLVNDVIMPPIGLLLDNVNFSSLAWILKEPTADTKAVSIQYGLFINNVIDFLIVAFCIFMVIKAMNAMKRKDESSSEAPTQKECPECCSEIPIKANRCPSCTSQLATS